MADLLYQIIRINTDSLTETVDINRGLFLSEVILILKDLQIADHRIDSCLNEITDQIAAEKISDLVQQKKYHCVMVMKNIHEFRNKFDDMSNEVRVQHLVDIIRSYMKQSTLSDDQNYRLYMDTSTEYLDLMLEYSILLESNVTLMLDLIDPSLKERPSLFTDTTLFPPILRADNLILDIHSGKVFNNEGELKIQKIPLKYSNTLNKKSNSSDNAKFISMLERITSDPFEYFSNRSNGSEIYATAISETKHIKLWFQIDKTNQQQIYLEITSSGERFQKISPADSDLLQTDMKYIYDTIPDCSFWVNNKSGKLICMNEKMQMCAAAQMNLDNTLTEIVLMTSEEKTNKYQIVLKSDYKTDITARMIWGSLHQIDTRSEITVFKLIETNRYRAELPNYRISFTENDDRKMCLDSDQLLMLHTEKSSFLPGSVLLKNKSDELFVILPDLPFVQSGSSSGYFSEHLPDTALSSFDNDPELTKKFSNKREFYKFKLDDEGFPIGETTKEKLFLCYYLMNIKEYDRAFACIKSIRRSHSTDGSFEVAEIAYRIIHESPANSDSSTGPNNDEILAIKTQVLLFAADILHSKKISWPQNDSLNLISSKNTDAVRKFYDRFPDERSQNDVISYIKKVSQSVFRESMRATNAELNILMTMDMKNRLHDNRAFFQWNSKTSGDHTNEANTHYQNILTDNFSIKKQLALYNAFYIKNTSELAQGQEFKNVSFDEINRDPISRAGYIINQEDQKKDFLTTYGINFFNDKVKRNEFEEDIEQLLDLSNSESFSLKKQILDLCMNIRMCSASIMLSIGSGHVDPLSFEDLVVAFMRNDIQIIADKLGIDPGEEVIKNLFSLIENAMYLDIQSQRITKIHENFIKCTSKNPSNDDYYNFALSLEEQKSEYTVNECNRSFLVFEYYQPELRIRKKQLNSIQHILNSENENACVQFVMGGGKTSVFLPIVAACRADGINISMVIVPEALIPVNEKDINKKTAKLFSSKAVTLFFDRNSSSSAEDFQRIYNIIQSIKESRGFLILSKETLQALELKYIELLDNQNPDLMAVEILGKILSDFRKNGKAIIDEADSVLNIRREFNYNNGNEVSIDSDIISDTVYLYGVINNVLPISEISASNVNQVLDDVFQLIINDESSFVCSIISHNHIITDSLRVDLIAWLKNDACSKEFEVLINSLSDSDKNRIAVFKQQMSDLLLSTLLRECNVSYGFSKINSENAVAIPYSCNNSPAESSRFSSTTETLNLTIQANILAPVSKDLFEKMVFEFYVKHLEQKRKDKDVFIDKPTTATIEFECLTGMNLYATYLKLIRGESLDVDFSALNANQNLEFTLKCWLIENYIAPEIVSSPSIIKSDSINLIDMLYSAVGISGTLQNHHTFHSRMHYAGFLNPDTDGRTLFHLFQKESTVESFDRRKIDSSCLIYGLKKLLLDNHNTRAIIDVGALFSGVSNSEVASAMASILPEAGFSDIQYIIYYDENNQLRARSVPDLLSQSGSTILPESIYLERSDAVYIREVLKCGPECCFTYYDQSHTTGSDIRQMPEAHAIVTIGENTHLRDLAQGVMRMRQFELGQMVKFVVSSAVNLKNNKIHDLVEFCEKNQNNDLLQDQYQAICKKITGMIRNQYMDILLNKISEVIPVPPDTNLIVHMQARKCAKHYIEYRLLSKVESPFEQFGHRFEYIDISQMLSKQIQFELICFDTKMTDFVASFNSLFEGSEFSMTVDPNLNTILKDNLKGIIQDAENLCPAMVPAMPNTISQTVETQERVNLQTMLQVEVEEIARYEKNIASKVQIATHWQNGELINKPDIKTVSLRQIDKNFDSSIFITENYGFLENSSGSLMNEIGFQRPDIFCLFKRDRFTQELSCVLLTSKEAEECLSQHNQSWCNDQVEFWIESPSGSVLYSTPASKPTDIGENAHYREMIEQVRFFHGDLDLVMKDEPTGWLADFAQNPKNFLDLVFKNPMFLMQKRFYRMHADQFDDYMLRSMIKKFNAFHSSVSLSSEHDDYINAIVSYTPRYSKEILSIVHMSNDAPILLELCYILHANAVLETVNHLSQAELLCFLIKVERTSQLGVNLSAIAETYRDHFDATINLIDYLHCVQGVNIDECLSLVNGLPQNQQNIMDFILIKFMDLKEEGALSLNNIKCLFKHYAVMDKAIMLLSLKPVDINMVEELLMFYQTSGKIADFTDFFLSIKSKNMERSFARYLPCMMFDELKDVDTNKKSEALISVYTGVISLFSNINCLEVFSKKNNAEWDRSVATENSGGLEVGVIFSKVRSAMSEKICCGYVDVMNELIQKINLLSVQLEKIANNPESSLEFKEHASKLISSLLEKTDLLNDYVSDLNSFVTKKKLNMFQKFKDFYDSDIVEVDNMITEVEEFSFISDSVHNLDEKPSEADCLKNIGIMELYNLVLSGISSADILKIIDTKENFMDIFKNCQHRNQMIIVMQAIFPSHEKFVNDFIETYRSPKSNHSPTLFRVPALSERLHKLSDAHQAYDLIITFAAENSKGPAVDILAEIMSMSVSHKNSAQSNL